MIAVNPLDEPSYYLEEGCGLFALACALRAGQGELWVLSRREGDAWSRAIPFEVTHVAYRDGTGQLWDVKGRRTPAELAQTFGLEAEEVRWEGPFDPVTFAQRFLGNDDRKPLYGGRREAQQLGHLLPVWERIHGALPQAQAPSRTRRPRPS